MKSCCRAIRYCRFTELREPRRLCAETAVASSSASTAIPVERTKAFIDRVRFGERRLGSTTRGESQVPVRREVS